MKLNPDEMAQAKALADAIDVQISLGGRPIVTDAHIFSAAGTSKLLLTAAYAHNGDDSSFIEMALQALAMIRGEPAQQAEPTAETSGTVQ